MLGLGPWLIGALPHTGCDCAQDTTRGTGAAAIQMPRAIRVGPSSPPCGVAVAASKGTMGLKVSNFGTVAHVVTAVCLPVRAVGSGNDSLGPQRSLHFCDSDRRYRPPLDRAHPHFRLEELMVAAAMDLGVEQGKVRILH
jgi:hypothetical protein